jgi:hypothetical protein
LGQLQSNNILTQGHRFAVNSSRNMISNIRTFLYFCTFFGLASVPASPSTLCYFVELMALTVTWGHIKNLISSIKYLHAAYNFNFPANDFGLDATLQGLKRRLARTPFQVLPITPTILRKMYGFLDMRKTSAVSGVSLLMKTFTCS